MVSDQGDHKTLGQQEQMGVSWVNQSIWSPYLSWLLFLNKKQGGKKGRKEERGKLLEVGLITFIPSQDSVATRAH